MEEDPTKQTVLVPPNLAHMVMPLGVHKRGMKILTWGEAGGGKSPFLASFPSPKVVIDSGEGGVTQYLKPDSGDVAFWVTHPDDFHKIVEYAMDNLDVLKSFVVDPATLLWEDWMDSFNEEFGGDIVGGQWKDVKAPWKMLHRLLNRSPLHVGYSAWVNDIRYDQPETAPGVKGKLKIQAQETPKIEKRLPHNIDLALQFRVRRDSKMLPTSLHDIIVTKARRPHSLDPEDLYIGKKWTFDERKPIDFWDVIVKPLLLNWSDGAVDYLGIDPREVKKEESEVREAAMDHAAGRMIRLISEQTDGNHYKHEVWPSKIAPLFQQLDEPHQKVVLDAHEMAKQRLGIK